MTHRTRIALAASTAVLATAGAASAAPGIPLQKDGPSYATGTSVTMAWNAATFTPLSKSREYVYEVVDMTDGGAVDVENNLPATTLFVQVPGRENGHRYRLSVYAREQPCAAALAGPPPVCIAYGPSTRGTAHLQYVRMDATGPQGSVQIDGGAQYARSRDVILGLTATDPPSAGQPSSGVDNVQISQDATFVCELFGDRSDCPVPMAASRAYVLDEGPDGQRTVRVKYRDKASPFSPGAPVFTDTDGNASGTYTDTIVLDRSQPTPVVTMGVPSADAGVPVAFSAASSTDATSGVDPTSAVWDFGDGTAPVNALQLNKSFANPGTHAGSLTVRDRAGNTNTQAFSFTVTGAPAPGGGGVSITNPGTGTAALTDPIRGAKRLNRAVQGKKLRIRVRLANRIQVRVSILRIAASGRAVVRRQVRTAGPGFAVFTFTAPKAGRHVVRIKAGADTLSFPMGIVRR